MRKKSFTLIEMLVVIGIIGVLAAMLGGPIARAMRSAKVTQCVNNLKQIGLSLNMYENQFNSVPLSGKDSTEAKKAQTSTSEDGATAANLLRLYVAGLSENLQSFACPVVGGTPKDQSDTDKNTVTAVRTQTDCRNLTDYNLTTCYSTRDESNKIIASDSPFSKTEKKWSIHDGDALRMDPNCLYRAGNVKTETKLAPDGSTEALMKAEPKSIYETASGGGAGADKIEAGKGKDTFIQPTGRGYEN